MKTIRQIADEIGVSKQTVYKRYKGKLHTVCAPYAHTEQGVLYLSEQAETLIKQDFLKDDRSVGAHTDTHTERSNGAVPEQSQEASVCWKGRGSCCLCRSCNSRNRSRIGAKPGAAWNFDREKLY